MDNSKSQQKLVVRRNDNKLEPFFDLYMYITCYLNSYVDKSSIPVNSHFNDCQRMEDCSATAESFTARQSSESSASSALTNIFLSTWDTWRVPSGNMLPSSYSADTFKCLQTDDLNLLLSDVLIGSAEQARWEQLTADANFSRPVPARQFFGRYEEFRELLGRSTSPSLSPSAYSPRSYEGNSVFYVYNASASTISVTKPEKEALSCRSPSSSFSARNSASRRLRDSMRNALFAKYFGNESSRKLTTRRRNSSAGDELIIANKEKITTTTRSQLADTNATNEEDEWKCLAAFVNFPQELIALPDEIRHEHRLVRTASGRQCVKRRSRRQRRRSSSSSTTSSSSAGQHGTNAVPKAQRHWAPPRRKFIYELSAVNCKDPSAMLTNQNGRCAGCSRLFDATTARRARVCYYYSRLFCPCCHQDAKYVLPAQILHNWNFKEYLICDAALQFLRENADQPVFHVPEINAALYGRVKALRQVCNLRIQMSHLWQYVQLCPHADHVETSHGYLKTMFTSVARRFLILENVHVFSILDLISVFNGNLIETFEPLVNLGRAHVEHCLECRQLAFFCQFCGRDSDRLFPFQLERVYRCDGCGALSHVKCRTQALRAAGRSDTQASTPNCAKCERIRQKKIRQFHRSPSQKSELRAAASFT